MASSPIIFMANNGEEMERVTDFIFLGSNITADGDCSRKIKRHFLLRRKAMTKIGDIIKSTGITLLTNFCLIRVMVSPVVMYGM